jgi:CheY-like chemotaxis protein
MMLNTIDETLRISTATSGQEALERLGDERPDLMLLDIVLPDIDGWQLLEAKNADDALRDIPVLIISAQDPQESPPTTEWLQIAMSRGLSVSEVLRCGRQAARALLYPAEEPD